MSPLTRIICLANSRKHGAYCVAGIEHSTGTWIRPVSGLDDGRVERATFLIDGKAPSLCDIVGIPLAQSGPDFGFECENLSILPGKWRLQNALNPGDLLSYCSQERYILHNSENHVTVQYLQSLPFEQRRTLQLVEAFEFEAFSTGLSAQGGHKWHGSFVVHSGERLTARITDPVLTEKLEQGYLPGIHCVVTVSLSMPFCPEDSESDEEPCWKLIAGVVELEPGTWPEIKSPSPVPSKSCQTRAVSPVIDDMKVAAALRSVFGFDRFKPNQQEIVRAILDGNDCFAVMPTGGGKSLCYQLPARLLNGTCLVISPLISLMKDQVDAAAGIGLRAAFLTSAQTDRQRIAVFRRLREGKLDLLYISPERFAMETFLNNLKRIPLSLIAIDEAHCISEWGHDFRPDYLYLSEITRHFTKVPITAFTATATHRVQQDIIKQLGLRNPIIIRASCNRPNLFYEVVPKKDIDEQILDFIRTRAGQAGIVYRTTRNSVDETASLLTEAGINALPYHAGLDDAVRQSNQEAFNHDDVDVVVATIAFGMGIDKPNVRFVVHGDLPKNMEAYYQETGRAGRDGEPAHCVFFFSRGDIPKVRYFIDQVENTTERLRKQAALNEMVLYGSSSAACRRRKILAYFGEELPEQNCGTCDVCTGAMEQIDVTREAQMLLSAISRTNQRFGAGHIIDIVCGANTKKIRQMSHEHLPTYGVGKDHTKSYWRQIVDDLLAEDIVRNTEGQYPLLKLTEAASAVLRGEISASVRRAKETPKPQPVMRPVAGDDPVLFERLRLLRRTLANERNVPPFVIFSDRTLHEMAAKKPTGERSMLLIHGVGETKWASYGAAFVREIASHLGEQPVETAAEYKTGSWRPPRVSKATRSPTVKTTWELVLQGLDIKEIALRRGLNERTVVDHLERLILDGKDIDISAYVPGTVRDHIERIYPRMKTALLREIVDTAEIPVTFDQAKLVRAWICSGKAQRQ